MSPLRPPSNEKPGERYSSEESEGKVPMTMFMLIGSMPGVLKTPNRHRFDLSNQDVSETIYGN